MIRRSVVTIIAFFGLIIASSALSPAADAATNAELVPGSRIVFPYYDLRPEYTTLLFLTNTSSSPVSVALEFYDASCARQDATVGLSAGDINLIDPRQVISATAFGSFLQGFIDVTTGADALIGTAVIVNVAADWAIAYNGAPARRQTDGITPFEPYPTRLFLPAFLTGGQLGNGDLTDGLLIVAAPHPTLPGAELPDKPVQASAEVFLEQEGSTVGHGQHHPPDVTQRSSGFSGHYMMLPIGAVAGISTPTLGWLSITNHAVDDTTGIRFGLVGLYIQTLLGSDGGSAMTIRLSGDPTTAPAP